MDKPEYDVAIVGYGPVGATLAKLLGQRSLRVVVIERETAPYHLPRAVCFDGEIIRLYQGIGIGEEVAATSAPMHGFRLENEAGEALIDWDLPADRTGNQGWGATHMFHQPEVEAMLRREVGAEGSVDVLLGREVRSLVEQGSAVSVSYGVPGEPDEQTVTASWVVGCDGGPSTTRRAIGSQMASLGPEQDWLVVDAVLRDGAELRVPNTFTGYCWSSRPHFYVPMREPRARWELMVMPDDDRDRIVSEEGVFELIGRFASPADIEIERAVIYTFRSLLADPWRQGRVFLAGDSAHLQPPFRAQGLCSGIRDVVNLAWKLAAVQAGEADAALLDTYESERRAHAETWINTATEIAAVMNTTDPEVARQRDAHMIANPMPYDESTPRLGPGLSADGDPPPAGFLSSQVVLDDGTRFDDRVGWRFLAAIAPGLKDGLPEDVAEALDDEDLFLVVDPESEAGAKLLALHGDHRAVIVRPDRYVLGVADDRDGLVQVVRRWTRFAFTPAVR